MGGSKWGNANKATEDFIELIIKNETNLDSVHFMLIYFNSKINIVLD